MKRDFTATPSNQFWVAGFTDTATWRGVVYVTFVIDAFPRRIVAIAAVRAVVSAQTSFASRWGACMRPNWLTSVSRLAVA